MNEEIKIRKGAGHAERGSVLIAAVIFIFAAVAATGALMNTAMTEYRIAMRGHLMGAAFNVAEAGLEHAMHALNHDATSGWNKDGSTWTREFTGYDFGNGLTGAIRVVILDATATPTIVSEGRVSGHPSGDVVKQLRVILKSGGRSFTANGLTAKQSITFSGNGAGVDSYDSSIGPWNSLTNNNDESKVASTSVEVYDVSVGNADIRGYVATGGGVPKVGPNGSIRSDDDSDGTVDYERVAYDFYADFPDVDVPDTTGWNTSF